jgi:hypothetical protein
MTAPTDHGHGHGHGHNGQAPGEGLPFQPEPHFAMRALQEDLEATRAEVIAAKDRLNYQRAVALQAGAEYEHNLALKEGQIEQLRAELADLRSKTESGAQEGAESTNGQPLVVDAAGVASGAQGGSEDWA